MMDGDLEARERDAGGAEGDEQNHRNADDGERKARADHIGEGIKAALPQQGPVDEKQPKKPETDAHEDRKEAEARERRQKRQKKSESQPRHDHAGIDGGDDSAGGVECGEPHGPQPDRHDDEAAEKQGQEACPQHVVGHADPIQNGKQTDSEEEGGKSEAESAVDLGAVDLGVRKLVLGHAKPKG